MSFAAVAGAPSGNFSGASNALPNNFQGGYRADNLPGAGRFVSEGFPFTTGKGADAVIPGTVRELHEEKFMDWTEEERHFIADIGDQLGPIEKHLSVLVWQRQHNHLERWRHWRRAGLPKIPEHGIAPLVTNVLRTKIYSLERYSLEWDCNPELDASEPGINKLYKENAMKQISNATYESYAVGAVNEALRCEDFGVTYNNMEGLEWQFNSVQQKLLKDASKFGCANRGPEALQMVLLQHKKVMSAWGSKPNHLFVSYGLMNHMATNSKKTEYYRVGEQAMDRVDKGENASSIQTICDLELHETREWKSDPVEPQHDPLKTYNNTGSMFTMCNPVCQRPTLSKEYDSDHCKISIWDEHQSAHHTISLQDAIENCYIMGEECYGCSSSYDIEKNRGNSAFDLTLEWHKGSNFYEMNGNANFDKSYAPNEGVGMGNPFIFKDSDDQYYQTEYIGQMPRNNFLCKYETGPSRMMVKLVLDVIMKKFDRELGHALSKALKNKNDPSTTTVLSHVHQLLAEMFENDLYPKDGELEKAIFSENVKENLIEAMDTIKNKDGVKRSGVMSSENKKLLEYANNLYGALGMIIMGYYFSVRITRDLKFLCVLADKNIPLPIEFKIMRPHQLLQVTDGIMLDSHGGKTPGKTIMASSQLMSGTDWQHGDAGGKFSVWKAHITRNAELQRVVPDMVVTDVVSGAGVRFMRPSSIGSGSNDYRPDVSFQSGDILVFAVPFNEARKSAGLCMSLTGSYDESLLAYVSSEQALNENKYLHFSSAPFYNALFAFNVDPQVADRRREDVRMFGGGITRGSICYPGHQKIVNQKAVGVVDYENYVNDLGYFGVQGTEQSTRVRHGEEFTYDESKVSGNLISHLQL